MFNKSQHPSTLFHCFSTKIYKVVMCTCVYNNVFDFNCNFFVKLLKNYYARVFDMTNLLKHLPNDVYQDIIRKFKSTSKHIKRSASSHPTLYGSILYKARTSNCCFFAYSTRLRYHVKITCLTLPHVCNCSKSKSLAFVIVVCCF